MSDLVTTGVAAQAVSVDPATLHRWVHAGLVTPALTTAGGHFRWDIDNLRSQLAALREARPMTGPSNKPEPVPVVAAIITSGQRVLLSRRNDDDPPWGFITGKIEPGESPADAAVREAKEETGLRIQAGDIIGRRVHPGSLRTMIYVAASPVHGTDVFVGDTDELAEVRWVTPDEADELTGGMIYEPVRQHIRKH